MAIRLDRVQGNHFGILVSLGSYVLLTRNPLINYCWYSHRVLIVGKSLFPLFALALDLPENFFDDKVIFLSVSLDPKILTVATH